MANHKRGRPKSRRAGCMCKYWKDNAFKGSDKALPASEQRTFQPEERSIPSAKKGKKKPWVILWRSKPDVDVMRPFDWSVHRRYTTKKARDEALEHLRKRTIPSPGSFSLYEDYEYKGEYMK